MIVVDASPLIVLTKINRLEFLKEVYGEAAIGPWVKREVVEQGRPVDVPGVRRVEIALQGRWLHEVQPTAEEDRLARRLLESTRLGEGEAESLALAHSRGLLVVLDDKEARTMARGLGVRHIGTAGILLAAFARGLLSYDEFEEAVRELSRVLWIGPDVIIEILRIARGLMP